MDLSPAPTLPAELSSGARKALRRLQQTGAVPARFETYRIDPAAVAELVDASLVTLGQPDQLVTIRHVDRHYIDVHGDGPMYVAIHLDRYESYPRYPHDGTLLATLHGAFTSMHTNDGGSTLEVSVNHPTGTDFEHDQMQLASYTIAAPTLVHHGTASRFIGILLQAESYPAGVDPLTVESEDSGPTHDCPTCDPTHPIGRYRPPADDRLREHVGRPVSVTTIPLAATEAYEAAIIPAAARQGGR